MNTQDVQDLILDSLFQNCDNDEIKRIRTFQEAGVMTRDQGLVITAPDGSEFQVTIVKSRSAQ